MNRRLLSHALTVGGVLGLGLFLGACGSRSATTARPGGLAGGTVTTHALSTSSTVTNDHGDENSGRLTPAQRAELGLSGPGTSIQAPTPQQWADPQAVAARFVLADTSYSAAEDPVAVNARRAAYVTPRLAADLATSSSGAARLEELRRRQASFTGEVLSITTHQANGDVTVVRLSVAVVLTSSDQPPDRRVRFYQLTLWRELSVGQWLVARAEQS